MLGAFSVSTLLGTEEKERVHILSWHCFWPPGTCKQSRKLYGSKDIFIFIDEISASSNNIAFSGADTIDH